MNYYKKLKYSDVCLIPSFGVCKSRSECDTRMSFPERSTALSPFITTSPPDTFKVPVVPANMQSVIDAKRAKWMSENGYFYIMHRFNVDTFSFVEQANKENWKTISISIGVNDSDEELIRKISNAELRVDYLTIDIAHGHSEGMKRMLYTIRQKATFCFQGQCRVIAGNVATPEGVRDLCTWGANVVKVGIGQGSPCTTKDKTGFTLPMFSCVLECAGVQYGPSGTIPVIADGGAQSTGDIAKAIRAGACMVMAGGIFAQCKDGPAETIEIGGEKRKAYFGSASKFNKGHSDHIEGVQRNLGLEDLSYEEKLLEIEQDLQSAISYAGGLDLSALRKVNYEAVT